ncbi:DUF397 domain-containing protein [Saccharothrix xinjiangensis]
MHPEARQWRKSSYSEGANTNCVEVAMQWRKSSYSGGENTNCVEVAFEPVAVGVRDSKYTAPQLAFSPAAWRAFLQAAPTR